MELDQFIIRAVEAFLVEMSETGASLSFSESEMAKRQVLRRVKTASNVVMTNGGLVSDQMKAWSILTGGGSFIDPHFVLTKIDGSPFNGKKCRSLFPSLLAAIKVSANYPVIPLDRLVIGHPDKRELRGSVPELIDAVFDTLRENKPAYARTLIEAAWDEVYDSLTDLDASAIPGHLTGWFEDWEMRHQNLLVETKELTKEREATQQWGEW